MRKSRNNFEKALEDLKRLKRISYGSSSDVLFGQMSPSYEQVSNRQDSVSEIKQTLKDLEGYFKLTEELPKGDAGKALKEIDFLISGVQNVFSFLENRDENVYQSLSKEYSELNQVYDHVRSGLNQRILETEDHKEKERDLESFYEHEQFLNNLVEVKRDRSYELFYMLDEENKRFYTDTLSQIIYKQGKFNETSNEGDPLTKTILWNSETTHKTALGLVASSDTPMCLFYENGLGKLEAEDFLHMHNAVMALFFAKYESTTVRKQPTKNNLAYFNDFLFFLRKYWAFTNSISPEQTHVGARNLAENLCSGIFENKLNFDDVSKYLYFKIQSKLQPDQDKKSLYAGQYISEVYDELYRFLAKFPNGPIFKAMDKLLDPYLNTFDPMLLGYHPSLEGVLTLGDKTIKVIRSPSPVNQGSILYATCNEEFSGFLQAKTKQGETILILNIQNRLARKDKARSRVLEECFDPDEAQPKTFVFSFPEPEDLLLTIERAYGEQETFTDFFSVMRSEFAKAKTESLFFLPEQVKNDILLFLDHSLPMLKDVFFSKKKILFKNDKTLLMHIISYLIVFKLIELLDPNIIVATSKDGLDYVSVFISGFAFFSKEGESVWDEHRLKLLITKILSPTLVARDRLVFANHMDTFSKFLNCLRKNRQNLKGISTLFQYNLEDWQFDNYVNEIIEVSHMHNL